MQAAAEISNTTLSMTHLIQSISEEADHMKLHHAYHQQGPGKGKNVDTTDEALTITSLSGSCDTQRKRCPGNCHNCGKAGHWARKCHTPKKDKSTDMQLGQVSPTTSTPKPDNKPIGSANTVAYMDNKGDGFWMVEEADKEVAPAHTVSMEPDPILHAPDNLEVPPANFDSLEEPFWGDDSKDWLGVEGGEWDLEEVANKDKEGAEAAITPAACENNCSKPSAQLEGEKTMRLTIGSEQHAALTTPTTLHEATPAGPTPIQSTTPGHESLPASTLLQPQRSACVQNPPCIVHNLQANKGITPMCDLQSPDPPAEDAKGAGGAYATAVGVPKPPGDAEEAGGVLAAIVKMPKPPEEAEEAGGACATIADMPELPKDPEGPKHVLMAETVDTEALEASTPTEDKHTACPVAQVPSQPRSLNLDDLAVPVTCLASSCTVIPMEISPQFGFQQIGIGDIYSNDILKKSEAVLSMQHKFSHKSHDLGTCILCTVKVNVLHVQPHGRLPHQQIQSHPCPFIRVQQVPTGPGPHPQVVLLQTEPEMFTHQSVSHLDSSPQIFLTPPILMHKDDPVVPSPSTGHRATPIPSGNNHHHGL
jgi:hypothetical protein